MGEPGQAGASCWHCLLVKAQASHPVAEAMHDPRIVVDILIVVVVDELVVERLTKDKDDRKHQQATDRQFRQQGLSPVASRQTGIAAVNRLGSHHAAFLGSSGHGEVESSARGRKTKTIFLARLVFCQGCRDRIDCSQTSL